MIKPWEGSPSWKDNERSLDRLIHKKEENYNHRYPFKCQLHTDLNTQSNAMREVVSFHHFQVVGIEAVRS